MRCSAARAVFASGRGWASERVLGEGITECELPTAPFEGSHLRVTVVDAAGNGSISRRMRRVVPRRSVGGTRASRGDAPATEAAKEKEILEALRRRGELAVAGAALETSLTVEEADRMLSALAAKDHLEVRVERGRLLYSLWEGDGEADPGAGPLAGKEEASSAKGEGVGR